MASSTVRRRAERTLPGLILLAAAGVATIVIASSWNERDELVVTSAVVAVLVILAAAQGTMLWRRATAATRAGARLAGLESEEGTFRALVERLPAALYIAGFGPQATWNYVSPRIEALLGFTAAEWMADSSLWMRQIHPDDRERVTQEEAEQWSREPGVVSSSEYRMLSRDGRVVWILDEAVIIPDEQGSPAFFRGYIIDITAQKEAEQALRESEEQTRRIIDTASYAYIGMGADGLIADWNQAAEQTFGWSREEVIGTSLADRIIPFAQREAHRRGLARFLESGQGPILGTRLEVNAIHRDGREFPVELTIWAVGTGEAARFSALVHDITLRKELERQLQHQAFHDSLTGLANRALFADRVMHAMARQERARRSMAVVFLDLDDFKTVNDSLGHAAGDELLVAIARRLETCLRPEDTCARLGGDEFAVLVESISGPHAAIVVAERIHAAIAEPPRVLGSEVSVQASIGIALGSGSESASEILRSADLAMYRAKADGKSRFAMYEPSMHERVLGRLALKAELQRSVVDESFELHYQPIVALQSGAIVGVEALVRWRHPERGLVPPDEFVPLAEETGLILPLGRYVLHAACRQVGQWRSLGHGDLGISVNISAKQLASAGLPGEVTAALREGSLEPSALTLEITESMLLDSQAVITRLEELRRLGVKIAIDDFGTGYSSLNYLRRFPVDALKIAKPFVDGIGSSLEQERLASAILRLGSTLGLDTVAEGIEHKSQRDRLRALRCGYGQGFYFSRPIPADEIESVLRRPLVA